MATNRPRYTVSVDEELFQRIEDFRFENRYPTRSEATVELIRRALEAIDQANGVSHDAISEDLLRLTDESIAEFEGHSKDADGAS